MDQKPYEASVRNYRKANKIPKQLTLKYLVTEARFCLIMKRVTLLQTMPGQNRFLERNPVNDIETEA